MRRVLFLAAPLLAGACTTQVVSSGGMSSVGPVLSVERFLQASNAGDLQSMARLFGTADGPISETGGTLSCGFKKLGSWFGLGPRCETIQEVEIRMDAIAQIIRHQDYNIVSEANVPGRINPTTRVGVDMRLEGRDIADVPFIVVRTDNGQWLVEEIGLTRITRGDAVE